MKKVVTSITFTINTDDVFLFVKHYICCRYTGWNRTFKQIKKTSFINENVCFIFHAWWMIIKVLSHYVFTNYQVNGKIKDLPTRGLTAESGQIKTGPSLTPHRAWNRIKSIDRSPPSHISIKTSSILYTCWILTILNIIGGFFLKVTL